MTIVITSPEPIVFTQTSGHIHAFLAGSIEMGEASEWQTDALSILSEFDNLTIFNPRCKNWDNTLKPDDPRLVAQIKWELTALNLAGIVLIHFEPGTMSPISLLELGRFGTKAVVSCPPGFWRKTNVDVFCDTYNIPHYDSLSGALGRVLAVLEANQ